MLIIDYNITPDDCWCLIPLQMNGPFKKEIYNSRLSHAALKQYSVIVSTQNARFLSKEPCSASWNNIICGVPSKVLHFPYFFLTVTKFPHAQQSDKLPLCQQATISLYKPIPTTDKATVLGKQSQNYSWLPWQQNKLSGEPQRERGVIYPRNLVWIYYTIMLLRAYQNIFGW